jgi:hypothetical protein
VAARAHRNLFLRAFVYIDDLRKCRLYIVQDFFVLNPTTANISQSRTKEIPPIGVRYGEKTVSVKDGLPKFKHMPADLGGSGDMLPE